MTIVEPYAPKLGSPAYISKGRRQIAVTRIGDHLLDGDYEPDLDRVLLYEITDRKNVCGEIEGVSGDAPVLSMRSWAGWADEQFKAHVMRIFVEQARKQ